MSNTLVLSLHEALFQKVLNPALSGYTDAELSVLWAEISAVSVSDKMALVAGATENNLASFDDAGQVQDSGYAGTSFALAAHSHTGYLRKNASESYDSSLYTFTFSVDTGPPFAIDATGGSAAMVAELDADKVDGYHAADLALAGHAHDTRYIRKDTTDTVVKLLTFSLGATAPFALHADHALQTVIYLDADTLDGVEGAGYATAAHTHAWGTITGTLASQTDLQSALDAKQGQLASGQADGTIVITDGTDIFTSPSLYSEMATAAQIALKYDEIAGVTGNLVAFATSGTTLADSGYAPADFAAASHTHNDIYFTEAELGAGSEELFLLSLQVDDGAGGPEYVVSSAEVAGTCVTPNGTLTVHIDGTTYYFLTAATADV